jgi:hypothetical protein
MYFGYNNWILTLEKLVWGTKLKAQFMKERIDKLDII